MPEILIPSTLDSSGNLKLKQKGFSKILLIFYSRNGIAQNSITVKTSCLLNAIWKTVPEQTEKEIKLWT